MRLKNVNTVEDGVDTTSQHLPITSTTLRNFSSFTSSPASSERSRKRPRNAQLIDNYKCEASSKKIKKRLRWSTITIYEFGIGLGSSTVPGKGGPSIGLSEKPEFTWTTKVGEMAECVEGVHRFTSEERMRLLEGAGVSEGMILRFSRETSIINCSRRQTLLEDITAKKEARKLFRQQKRRCKVDSPRSPCASPILGNHQMILVNNV